MESILASLLVHVNVLREATNQPVGSRPRINKTERLRAVNEVKNAVEKKSTIAALTAASTLEIVRGPDDGTRGEQPPLGWGELAVVLVETLVQTCTEALNSKTTSRSGTCNLKLDYMACFRVVLKSSMTNGPKGVIRPIVPAFLYFSSNWLSEPPLRALLADDIWQCVRDLLQDEANRAMLTTPYIDGWGGICVEQLTGRGPLHHPSSLATKLAGEVLEIIPQQVFSCDTMTQSTKGLAPSKMAGGDYGYAIICKHCCNILIISQSMSNKRLAKELQSIAFRSLTTTLSDHFLDVVGSSAVKSVINLSLKPILSCWTDRRHQDAAIALASVLLRLDPNHKSLSDKCRQRILADMRDGRSSVVRSSDQIKEHLIDAAAACISFRESLQFAASTESGQWQVIVWLRVAHAIMSRRILKPKTSIRFDTADLMDQCTATAETVASVFKVHQDSHQTLFSDICLWSARVAECTAAVANKIHCEIVPANAAAVEAWQKLFYIVSEQISKTSYSSRGKGTRLHRNGESVHAETLLLQTASLLSGLSIFDTAVMYQALRQDHLHKNLPYPLSKIASAQGVFSPAEVGYSRNIIARCGIQARDGGLTRLRLVRSLVGICDCRYRSIDDAATMVLDGSSAAVGITHGECSVRPHISGPSPFWHPVESPNSPLGAYNSFQLYFGFSAGERKISGNGRSLVKHLKNENLVFDTIHRAMQSTTDLSEPLQEMHDSGDSATPSSRNSTRFSVDAGTTLATESEILERLYDLVDRYELTSVRARELREGSNSTLNSNPLEVPGRNRGFASTSSCSVGMRVIMFICNYLLEAISCGCISLHEEPADSAGHVLQGLTELLKALLCSFSASNISFFGPVLGLLNKFARLCASMRTTLLKNHGRSPSSRIECATLSPIFRRLSEALELSLNSLAKTLCTWLTRSISARKEDSVAKVQKHLAGILFPRELHHRRSAKRTKPVQKKGRKSKRRRVATSDSDSIGSSPRNRFQGENESIGFDDDEQESGSSDASLSDDFGDHMLRTPTWNKLDTQVSSQSAPSLVDMQSASSVLCLLLSELPDSSDGVLDICLRSVESDEECERVLSPDGFERSALACSLVESFYLELRECFWSILLSLDSAQALEAFARDVIRVGLRWKDLEDLSHSYDSFYVDSLQIRSNNRKTFPMPVDIERLRVSFLDHARLFIIRCFIRSKSGTLGIGDSTFSTGAVTSLISALIDISEHFRTKHAFRMPRQTRVAYMKFGIAAIQMANGSYAGASSSEENLLQASSLREAVKAIQTALRKFLTDSEALVRLAAAKAVPSLLTSFSHQPDSEVEADLQDSIPQTLSCQDTDMLYRDAYTMCQLDDPDEGKESVQLDLSNEEKSSCLIVSESFRTVGSQSKACTAFLVLGEVGCHREELIPFCIVQILLRIIKGAGCLSAAYQVIARMCAARGYHSPAHFYRTFARLIIPRWFKDSQDLDMLHKLPSSLFVDAEHNLDTALYDWMRDQQSNFVPEILVRDNAPSFPRASKFANMLGIDLESLLLANVGPFSLVFPMQFIRNLHERGKELWEGIDTVLGGRSQELMFKYKHDVLRLFLGSVSSGSPRQGNCGSSGSSADEDLGFCRDSRSVHPPFYDPLVIACAMNQLFESDSKVNSLPRSVLRGSLFSAIRDEQTGAIFAENFDGFVAECQKGKISLLRTLLSISRFSMGPPVPQPTQSRLDGFFCIGMVWRMLGVNVLVKSPVERVMFYRLIVRGFEQEKTMRDATWLLAEVQERVIRMEEKFPDVRTDFSDLSMNPANREHLLCLCTSQERQMYELLSAVSPGLVSVVSGDSTAFSSNLRENAAGALHNLLQLCHDKALWTVIICNGPLPNLERLSKARKVYESSKSMIEVDEAKNDSTKLLSSIERFQGIFRLRSSSQSLSSLFACLQEISSLLTESAVSDISDMIHGEAWLRSDGQMQPTVTRIIDAISSLIVLIHETNTKLKRRTVPANAIALCPPRPSETSALQLRHDLSEEIGHVMSLLGLLHPQSSLFLRGNNQNSSIPSILTAGRYEDVESGIERGLYALVELLRGSSAIAAETALSTLLEMLQSEDGKKVFLKEKERLLLMHPIRSAARKLATTDLQPKASVTQDPYTGEQIITNDFPELLEPHLWSVEIEEYLKVPHDQWMRRLCFVLSRHCASAALRTMAPSCYISYEFSRELLPYLLMDIVTTDDHDFLLQLSKLIKDQIFLNPIIPEQVLGIFIHSLDVLCQIGGALIHREGVSRWVLKGNSQVLLKYRYVLDIPYSDAAKAALRSRSYFSAIRFAQMHVDHVSTNREFQDIGKKRRAGRRQSSSSSKDPALEQVERDAKREIADIIREAMTRINEQDGVRAFGCAESLSMSVSNLATLDHDWTKSIGALDNLGRRVDGPTPLEPKSHAGDNARISHTCMQQARMQQDGLRRELLLMQTFMGLGTLSIATDYWTGLRARVLRVGAFFDECGVQAENHVAKLNDLRYALAWKLGQWESPPLLASRNEVDTHESYGFHESIYQVLQAFRLQRWGEISRLLAQARRMELRNLAIENVGASAVTIFQSSARLRLYQILEDFHAQYISGSNLSNTRSSNIALSEREMSFPQERRPIGESEQRFDATAGHCYPPSNIEGVCVMDKILDGYLGVHDHLRPGNLCMYVYPFDDSILTEDLPVAIARSVGRSNDVVRAASSVSMRVLAKGGNGSWARASSCLEEVSSKMVTDASQVNRVALKLQSARLQWSATQDASLKKLALETVRGIIATELGGAAIEGHDCTPSSGSINRQVWIHSSGTKDSAQYAYLRSEACILASNWSLDMRTSEAMALFNTFFRAGLEAVESIHAKNLTGRMHFAMATFADAQINRIDSYRKTRNFDQMVSEVRDAEDRIDKLQTIKNERKQSTKGSTRKGSPSRQSQLSGGISDKVGKDLDSFIRERQRKASQERTRLEKIQLTYQKWQVLACANFAACLRDDSAHNLRAAFRLVAIWLDAAEMREAITKTLLQDGSPNSHTAQSISIPPVKLLPLAPQLCSRLNASNETGSGLFQRTLSEIISRMAEKYPSYCLWQLLALSNSTRTGGNEERYSSLYRGDKGKKDAADAIMNSLRGKLGRTLDEMRAVADAYIQLSETAKPKNAIAMDIKGSSLVRLGELHHVTVPTVPLPLDGSVCSSRLPHIARFERLASICSGLSKPLRVVCIGSDGRSYPQMVKGRDDLRGDAVMEQLFTILNGLLERDDEASRRSLLVRTYRIIPLSPFSGIMQFVSNTTQFKDLLVEGDKTSSSRVARKSLHERYRPTDMKHQEFQNKTFPIKSSHEIPQRLKVLRQIWHLIQPVFHFFFLEQWPDPMEWFSHQLAYSRSVAVMSIVGFILGLGDRHLSNILLDVVTGEVVHIDFGIAFEQGKLLPTPEQMPFRLTRDIVDGFGIAGVEGIFRRCSEVTLSVMRRNKDVLLTVVEVLLHDPMFNWDLAPEVVIREQLSLGVKDMFDSDDLSKLNDSAADSIVRNVKKNIKGNSDAKKALNRISEKLDGLEGTERLSIEGHVARLIDEAQAFHVIASVYPGWSPWL